MIAYQLISDITVTSATTSVSFTGLNITKDDDYLLVADISNTGTGSDMFIYANNNTTKTNYYYQHIYAGGTTRASVRENVPEIAYVNSSQKGAFISKIKITNNGYFVWQSAENRNYVGNSLEIDDYYGTSTFTLTSLTSLTIQSAYSNSIGTNSRFQLYKLTAEKVADIIVSSPTTSVDITGLAIDKGSEYMLVSDTISSSSSGNGYALYVNGNTTSSNYYMQYIVANSNSLTSGRYQVSELTSINLINKSFAIANIKLTNNGYFVFQSSFLKNYVGGTNMMIENIFNTSTFTMSSITSLVISSALDMNGSRFTLYKLK